jgi:hypothetical protein
VRIRVEDRTGNNDALPYAFAWIEAHGPGAHHAGYDAGDQVPRGEGAVAPTLTSEPAATTTIYCDPENLAEAQRMERLVFPGAEIRHPLSDDIAPFTALSKGEVLWIALGRDFADLHDDSIRAFELLMNFLLNRAAGSPDAYDFVTEEMADAYRQGDEELSMYEYARARNHRIGVGTNPSDPADTSPRLDYFLVFSDSEGFTTEQVRVDSKEMKVVQASVIAEGSS